MISVEEAKRILLAEAGVLDCVDVPLGAATGRVLAEPVFADRDVPPADTATMDGFAVRSLDVAAPGAKLRIVGEIRAGDAPPEATLAAGESLRIFTGALVPPGADAVVMVERTRSVTAPASVEVMDRVVRGENVRARGEDVRAGEAVLAPFVRIRAAETAVLAALGCHRVRTIRPPRVSVLSTGNELVAIEQTPLTHQVRNSNARALLAQLAELGFVGTDLGTASDERGVLAEALRAGITADVLLVTGGVSAGSYDFVRETLVELGMRVLFHGVAVRPGKPVLAGRAGKCLVLGLPGNPVSAFTMFAVFAAPALRKMEGEQRPEPAELQASLTQPIQRRSGRPTYQLAAIEVSAGRLLAQPIRSMGSGDVISLARANAFLRIPAGTEPIPAGTMLPALLWRETGLR